MKCDVPFWISWTNEVLETPSTLKCCRKLYIFALFETNLNVCLHLLVCAVTSHHSPLFFLSLSLLVICWCCCFSSMRFVFSGNDLLAGPTVLLLHVSILCWFFCSLLSMLFQNSWNTMQKLWICIHRFCFQTSLCWDCFSLIIDHSVIEEQRCHVCLLLLRHHEQVFFKVTGFRCTYTELPLGGSIEP